MAGKYRQSPTPLEERLADDIWNWDFFQAVRMLECDAQTLPRVGWSTSASEDPIRFAQHVSVAFAPTDLESLELKEGRPPKLSVRFSGLTGPNGPLPLRFTEFAYYQTIGRMDPEAPERLTDERISDTLAQFFDIFHHRIFSFFYRAWASARKHVDFDRPGEDRYRVRIGSTFGMGTPGLRKRAGVPEWSPLAFAGHLSCQTRHPGGLEGILSSFFATTVKVENCIGHWLNLPRESRCHLGKQGADLGTVAVIGRRVPDRQTKFRLHIGPVDLETFTAFLPGHKANRYLHAWVYLYTNKEWDWDFRLILCREEVPTMKLGQAGRLGWTAWLRSKPYPKDAKIVISAEPGS